MLMPHMNVRLVRWTLAGVTLLFGLLTAPALASLRSHHATTMRFDVPLIPYHAVHVHVGNISVLQGNGYILHPVGPTRTDTWRVEAWYRSGGARPGIEVVSLPLPLWPLMLALAGAPVACLILVRWASGNIGARE